MRRRRSIIGAVLALGAAVGTAGADPDGISVTYKWIDPAGGSWFFVDNWDPMGIPGPSDHARFSLAADYDVNVLVDRTVGSLDALDGTVSFSTTTPGTTLNVIGAVVVEGAQCDVAFDLVLDAGSLTDVQGGATLRVTDGGSLRAGDLQLGTRVGALSKLLVVGPGAAETADATVGFAGSLEVDGGALDVGSSLEIATGQMLVAAGSSIEFAPGATMAVTDEGVADWDASITVQDAGDDPTNVTIKSGGVVEVAFSATVGAAAGSSGSVGVDGGALLDGVPGAFLPSQLRGAGGGAGADLEVGVEGHGVLDVTGGALVRFGDDGVFARERGSSSLVLVDGVDADFATPSTIDLTIGGDAHLHVGDGGDAVLEVTDGGIVDVAGDALFALQPGSSADVTVSGNGGSVLTPSTLRAGDDMVLGGTLGGVGGTADVRVEGGATLVCGDFMLIRQGGTLSTGSNVDLVAPNRITVFGTLEGGADVETNELEVFGTLDPGAGGVPMPGELSITGDVVFDATGELLISVFGSAWYEHDSLYVNGDLELAGTLVLDVPTGFAIEPGTSLPIIEFKGAPIEVAFDEIVAPPGLVATTALGDELMQFLFVTFEAACPADLDGTGDVGFSDVLQLLAAWGPCAGCDAGPRRVGRRGVR